MSRLRVCTPSSTSFSTPFALQTQEAQIRCFENVAAHLADEGVFVVEAFVPDLTRFDRQQRVDANRVGLEDVWLDVARHHPEEQRVESQHVRLSEQGVRFYPVQIRYAYPSELDLMARLADLRSGAPRRLEERALLGSDWNVRFGV